MEKEQLTSTEKLDLLDERYLRMAGIWAENSYCPAARWAPWW
jgi:hypothetical protein